MSAIISVHDVSPRTLAACQRLRDNLSRAGVGRATLLVIPDHHGGSPLWRDAPTVRWLRGRIAAGDEVAQHGHLHLARRPPLRTIDWIRARWLTRGEGECLTQLAGERDEMLGPVRRRLEDALGAAVAGFVAPAWLAPELLVPALIDADFAWYESRGGVRDLRRGADLRAPVLTFAGGAPARIAASRVHVALMTPLAARQPVVRLAVHPCDATDPIIRMEVCDVAVRLVRGHVAVTTAVALAEAASD